MEAEKQIEKKRRAEDKEVKILQEKERKAAQKMARIRQIAHQKATKAPLQRLPSSSLFDQIDSDELESDKLCYRCCLTIR